MIMLLSSVIVHQEIVFNDFPIFMLSPSRNETSTEILVASGGSFFFSIVATNSNRRDSV